jgi:hypothetical protein
MSIQADQGKGYSSADIAKLSEKPLCHAKTVETTLRISIAGNFPCASPMLCHYGLFLVSYPFAFHESNTLRNYGGKIFLVGGKLDDIGPVDQLMDVYKAMPTIQKSLKIIPTDHFYWGKEEEIAEFIKEVVPSP